MKYQIIYDRPGKLRLRMGKYAFSREQGYGIAGMLRRFPGVISATVSYNNGGILIYYEGSCREALFQWVENLKRTELPSEQPTEDEKLRELDETFQNKVIGTLARHFFLKWFMPAPVRVLHAAFRAAGFMKKGLRILGRGQLRVEVLDAAAITCAFAQRSPKTASSIMLLLKISEYLEEYTRKKTRSALAGSLAVQVDRVWKVTDSGDVSVPMASIQPGDCIRVQAGAMIPVDGTVRAGEAMINESSMTGEPLAVRRTAGHTVYAGTVVEEGNIVAEVRKLAGKSRIQAIVGMIDQSEALKAGIQGRAERLADSIVPFSFAASLTTLLLTRNLTKAMSVLMVDYSCAMKLPIPIAVISAMKEAAGRRILVKGGKFMEAYAQADTIIFDKTGTLTAAEPKVACVIPFAPWSRKEVLRDAACLEEHFPHSVARAIVAQAARENLKHEEEHAKVEYVVAHGISTILREQRTQIGSAHFIFEDLGIPCPKEAQKLEEEKMHGLSVIYLAVGGRLAGMIGIEDPVRPEAASVMEQLRQNGFRHIIMMTGDNEASAGRACRELGITEFQAQVLPEDKAAMVKKMKGEGHTVVMVGDGINDSPALAAADVSIAMKDSSALAREVADVTLLSENLEDLILFRKLCRSLMKRIQRNYGWILGINTSLLVSGMAGILPPATAALLHNGSTMAISGLSMRPYLRSSGTEEKER